MSKRHVLYTLSRNEPLLLEVNSHSVSTGKFDVFVFGPTVEVPYNTAVAEITPDEFEMAKAKPESLPKGWSLSLAVALERRLKVPEESRCLHPEGNRDGRKDRP